MAVNVARLVKVTLTWDEMLDVLTEHAANLAFGDEVEIPEGKVVLSVNCADGTVRRATSGDVQIVFAEDREKP